MTFVSVLKRPFQGIIKHYAGHPARLTIATTKTVFIAHLLWEHFYAYSSTYGPSMLPTLEVFNDGVLVSRWYRRGRGVKVGDIVTFDSVIDPEEKVIKRIIGLEGDYVLRDSPGSGSNQMIQVPEGHCWVVGDNLHASRDSRTWGPLPMGLIKGKVLAKISPLSERKWLANGLQTPGEIEGVL